MRDDRPDEPTDEPIDEPPTIGFDPRRDSVTRFLETSGTKMPRHAIDENATQPAPDTDDRNRYQVLGELARGGMGVVLRSRDVDLGRDVAMKVLHAKYLERPTLVDRFVEEAQIGGQLEHPGIVPVYDVGTGDDKRPFFTMKMIKGRTLADLLSERAAPADDRREFLTQFLAVCNAMAFAHSRGVVHRDLKPSNVMVGAFGEVLVVDWGLGKVLDQGGVDDERKGRRSHSAVSVVETVRSGSVGSHSLVGSVFGTPAYMPPEQARGEVETLDRRSDVFALGAILCEILTGAPPYTGSDETLVQRAARADLTDALARLKACDAPPELVELAEQCLAPAMGARPKNAAELAERVGSHLASTVNRARQAVLDAAEAKVRSERLKRSRRLTNAISVAAIVGVAVIGLTAAWVFGDRSARREETESVVFDALAEANLAQGRAAAEGTSTAWEEAVGAAELAVSVASARGADTELRTSTERVAEEMRDALADARRRESVAARDAEALQTSSLIRATWAEWPDASLEEPVLDMFRAYGIDFENESPESIDARLRESAIGPHLIALLGRLANFLGYRGRAEEGKKYRDIAVAAVDDPWVKEYLSDPRPGAEIMERVPDDIVTTSPKLAWYVADRLSDLGEHDRALELTRELLRLNPDDRMGHLSHAYHLLSARPSMTEAASRHTVANAAIAPERAFPWLRLMLALGANGELPLSEAAARRGVEIGGESAVAWTYLAFTLQMNDKPEEANAAMERAREINPREALVPIITAILHVYQGDARGADTHMRAGLILAPVDSNSMISMSRLLEARDKLEEARDYIDYAARLRPHDSEIRTSMAWVLARQGRFREAVKQQRLAMQRAQAQDSHIDRQKYLAMYQSMAALAPQLTEYRLGEFAPETAAEMFALGQVAWCRGYPHAAAGLFEQAFEVDSTLAADVQINAGTFAARAAMHAVLGVGKDAVRLPEEERRRLRSLAQNWLGQTVSGFEAWIKTDARGWWGRVTGNELPVLRLYSSFDTVRGAAIEQLPEDERAGWIEIWRRVDEIQRRGAE